MIGKLVVWCAVLPICAAGLQASADAFSSAVNLIQQGRFQEAMEPLQGLIAKNPMAFEPNYLLGITLSQVGRNAEAIPRLRAAKAARPSHAGVLTLLGLAYLRENYPLDSAESLEAAAAGGKLPEKTALLLAEALHAAFQFDRALQIARETAVRFPQSADAQFRLGLELETAGEFADARDHCEQAVKLRPDFVEAHWALGRFYYRSRKLGEAASHLRAALEKNPTQRQVRLEFAKVLAAQGKSMEAREILGRLISEADSEPEPHLLLARILASAGEREASAREQARFTELTTSAASGGMGGNLPSGQVRRYSER